MAEYFFASREEASAAAAEHIRAAVDHRLAAQDAASLVASGGTTPARCFEILSEMPLDWARVHVLPSDERWVEPDDEHSNERLLRTTLLTNRASAASLEPVFREGMDAEAGAAALNQAIRALPFPFACSLLGMGSDGHFASLFPDAGNLARGLDLDSELFALPVSTSASPFPRVSLTLSALARSDEVLLLFFGDDKRAVYEAAGERHAPYPVTKLLFQKRAPVHVYWAP